jgi:hypothetical protein
MILRIFSIQHQTPRFREKNDIMNAIHRAYEPTALKATLSFTKT